ncbi:MAG: hypothetical protein LBP65_00255 [Puniceicoccales bacterium]|jgi:hypothetical protein|nr:hypothetical protein [Puniceicoccales bacterium]
MKPSHYFAGVAILALAASTLPKQPEATAHSFPLPRHGALLLPLAQRRYSPYLPAAEMFYPGPFNVQPRSPTYPRLEKKDPSFPFLMDNDPRLRPRMPENLLLEERPTFLRRLLP